MALAIFLLFTLQSKSQDLNVSFEKDSVTVKKNGKAPVIVPIKIKSVLPNSDALSDYLVAIVPDAKSNIPFSDYTLDFSKTVGQLREEETIYLVLKDTLPDRERKLILDISIKKGTVNAKRNNGYYQKLVITIPKFEKVPSLKEYTYLSYVGTNFDLVDGIKAQNLFFATNVFVPPTVKSKAGFYLSLYGSRAMSDIDSTGNLRRTYKITSLNDTSYVRHTEQSKMVTTRFSDNIGAHISLLIRMFSKSDNDLKLYYSPSLEFVWRRTNITQVFKDPTLRDSTTVIGNTPGSMEYSNTIRRNYNEYSFNAGLAGLFLALENNDVSVRVHCSVGYSSNFYPVSSHGSNEITTTRSHDIFFAGRAWITEPKTGITLQAEITNTMDNPRPFFGVTLSKAFNLRELAGIFSPITSR